MQFDKVFRISMLQKVTSFQCGIEATLKTFNLNPTETFKANIIQLCLYLLRASLIFLW